MAVPDAAVLGHHLRRLSPAEFAAFVADLWAARGYETRRDGDRVLASRDGTRLVVAVGWATDDADVVVTARARRQGTDGAAADRRVVDARGIRDALWYALDRETAAALCREHLGAPPSDLRPPRRRRLRTGLDAVAPLPSHDRVAGSAAAVALLVVVAVVAGAVTTPGPSVGGQPDASAGGGTVAAGTPGSATPTAGTVEAEVGALGAASDPPGLSTTADGGRGGVTDLSTLAAAHARALDGARYRLRVDLYRPREGVVTATRIHRDIDVTVAGDRYLLVESTAPAKDPHSELRRVRGVYHEGQRWVAVAGPASNATYTRGAAAETTPPGTSPHVFAEYLVWQWLGALNTTATEYVADDGTTRYRVVGRGFPGPDGTRPVENYTVQATVAPSGLVAEGHATYALASARGRYPVRFEWTYDRVGTATVERPAWYDRAAGNATATDGEDGRTTAETPREGR
jgi:hypothetical protein